MSQTLPAERRRYVRHQLSAPVRVSTIDAEMEIRTGRRYFRCFEEACINFSRGGISIRGQETLTPGLRVLLELTTLSGYHFDAVARVTWAQPDSRPERRGWTQFGAAFLGYNPSTLAHFDSMLRSKPRREDD